MLKLDFNSRESAIRKKYFDLIRDSDSGTAAHIKPDPENEKILEQLADPLFSQPDYVDLSFEMKQKLW
jgi:hypothetical protein